MVMTQERYSRQAALVPLDRLAGVTATVIGVGAIGRQVALQLAAIGAQTLQLLDFDTVDETNVVTQGYLATDVGRPKVLAAADSVRQINPDIGIQVIEDRYRPPLEAGQAVFCCVDSIAAREAIWRSAGELCRFWTDGRMLAEVIRIVTASEEIGRDHYPKTLFQQAEAQQGSCTARSTIYSASIAAGLMVHQFTRWLRRLPLDRDTTLNLLSGEWAVA